MSHRMERFSSTLKQCIADILSSEIQNPLLKSVVISDIIVEHDLRSARVFVSSPMGNLSDIVQQLNGAKGFIKKSIGKQMYLKYVPDIKFLEYVTLHIDTPNKDNFTIESFSIDEDL